MNEKKSRIVLFILGISLGLLVGAATVFVFTPKHTNNGVVSENMIEQIVNKVYGLISSKKEVKDSLISKQEEDALVIKNRSNAIDKSKDMSKRELTDSIAEEATRTSVFADSLKSDSVSKATLTVSNLNEDIVVKKDELIASKAIDLINMDYQNTKTTSHTDSLLQAVSGIRDASKKNDAKYLFQVELWQSPINYKGYKLAKNKLILFGVDTEAPLKLFNLGDIVYLKCADIIYKLDNYPDYKAFEKVSNPQIVSLLNK